MDYRREMQDLVYVVDRRWEMCMSAGSLVISCVTLGIIIYASDQVYDTFDQSGLYHNITKIVKIACKELNC